LKTNAKTNAMKSLSSPYLATLLLSMTAEAAGAERLADPTRPPDARTVSSVPAPDALRVEAVLRSTQRDLAIVNGKLVRAGDRIGSARIEAILPDGVRYVRDGQTHVARLQQSTLQVRRSQSETDR
jgi:MSHA biogenesis protein MshK